MRLILATEAQKRLRDPVMFTTWGDPLTSEQWVEREAGLRAQAWAKAEMKTWLLCEDGSGEVLSSCETYRMNSALRGEAGSTYAFASVFTEERLRGRGLASELISRVLQRLGAEDPGAQASILFSEVGPRIYERLGYVARPEWDEDWLFPPSTAGVPAGVIPPEALAGALDRVPRPADPFVVFPTADQVDWHRERERLYARALHRPRAMGCGARAGGSTMLWTANLRYEELFVLWLHAQKVDEADALIESARRVAAGASLQGVRIWKCAMPQGWSVERSGGKAVPRPATLAMIKPLRADLRPEDWRCIQRALWV